MKKLLILTFAILAIGCTNTPPEKTTDVSINNIRTINGKFYDFSNVSGFTGTIIEHDIDHPEIIVAKAQVKDGILNGTVEGFRLDGSLMYQQRYLNGILNGKTISFNEKEVPTYEREYLNGRSHGKYKIYYDDGSLKYSQTYINNKLNGQSISYNKDGSIEIEEVFKDGVSISKIDHSKPNQKIVYTFGLRGNQSVVDKKIESDD